MSALVPIHTADPSSPHTTQLRRGERPRLRRAAPSWPPIALGRISCQFTRLAGSARQAQGYALSLALRPLNGASAGDSPAARLRAVALDQRRKNIATHFVLRLPCGCACTAHFPSVGRARLGALRRAAFCPSAGAPGLAPRFLRPAGADLPLSLPPVPGGTCASSALGRSGLAPSGLHGLQREARP